jgi:hypothetical protein
VLFSKQIFKEWFQWKKFMKYKGKYHKAGEKAAAKVGASK